MRLKASCLPIVLTMPATMHSLHAGSSEKPLYKSIIRMDQHRRIECSFGAARSCNYQMSVCGRLGVLDISVSVLASNRRRRVLSFKNAATTLKDVSYS